MEKEKLATQAGQKSSGFTLRFHLMIFLIVIGMLFVINLATTPLYLWALYPLFSWLIAINLHITAIITKKTKSSKKALLGHLALYLSVNLLLAVINFLTADELNWVFYPLFFWGVGVLFHGVAYEEFYSKKPTKVREGKMKLKLKQKFPQLDRHRAKSKREKLLAASAPSDKSLITTPKTTITPKGKKEEKPSEQINISEEDKKEIEKTESEIDIKKDEVFCIVHKGPIDGTVYICPNCKTYYCYKCASVLKENGEKCWSCEAEINP